MPRSMHLHTEIYPNLKSISELFKMYMKSLDSFILASRDNWVSCNQTLGCLRFTETVEFLERSLASMLMRYCCSMIGCYFFSRHNRFAETHSHLQLSYHITDRLLAAGNKHEHQRNINAVACSSSLCLEGISSNVFNTLVTYSLTIT